MFDWVAPHPNPSPAGRGRWYYRRMFEAFELGPFILWTHAVFLLIGSWLAIEFFLRLAERANLPLYHFQEHAWWYLAAFLGGGRLAAVLAEYHVYIQDFLRVFVVWDGGFSFLGGAVGIGVILFLVTRQSRATFLQWLDVLSPAAMFGWGFDWLGRFAAGQSYGRPTDMLWGVTYDAMNVRYTVPVHPVQLYYATSFFFLTFLLLIVRKISRRAGAETLVGITLAATMTMFFETFRGDFGIPVFATKLDFLVLVLLFFSLSLVAVSQIRMSPRALLLYVGLLIFCSLGYALVRPWFPFTTRELRFSQFLAVLVLLASIVYVTVHRRRYPYL